MSQTSKYESRNPIQIALVRRFLTSVTKAVLSTGKRNIADVGCADGYVYQFLRDHAGVPFDYVGYDVDLAALERAKARFPGIRLERGSVYDFDTSADLVLCLEVLEHLTDSDKALEHLASLTRRLHRQRARTNPGSRSATSPEAGTSLGSATSPITLTVGPRRGSTGSSGPGSRS